jgi:hypothetical protein
MKQTKRRGASGEVFLLHSLDRLLSARTPSAVAPIHLMFEWPRGRVPLQPESEQS